MDVDDLPEEMALAIEIIRQLENLDYRPETIIQAMTIVCQDTLNRLSDDDCKNWRHFIINSLMPQK